MQQIDCKMKRTRNIQRAHCWRGNLNLMEMSRVNEIDYYYNEATAQATTQWEIDREAESAWWMEWDRDVKCLKSLKRWRDADREKNEEAENEKEEANRITIFFHLTAGCFYGTIMLRKYYYFKYTFLTKNELYLGIKTISVFRILHQDHHQFKEI